MGSVQLMFRVKISEVGGLGQHAGIVPRQDL